MKLKLVCLLVAAICISSGCASKPSNIRPAYVSPLKYKNYDCDQIALEMDHVGRKTTELYYSLRKKRKGDNWQMGVGLVLFWPTLFALEGGDGPEASEYAQLLGEYEALREMAVEKRCSLDELPPSPEELIETMGKKDDRDQEEEDTK